MRRDIVGRFVQRGADVGCHRHFRQRHRKPAIREVMRRAGAPSRINSRTKSPFSRSSIEIDRRRRALFARAEFAQIHRLTEPAFRFADQQDRLAVALEGERRAF